MTRPLAQPRGTFLAQGQRWMRRIFDYDRPIVITNLCGQR